MEKAKNALNELAIEEQAIQERKDFWVNNNYGLLIKKLNSDKFASFKSSLHPLMQTLADERDVIIQKEQEEKNKIEIIEKLFKQFNCLVPGVKLSKKLIELMDTDEEIEYGEQIDIGESAIRDRQNGYLLTNKRIIYFNYTFNKFKEFEILKKLNNRILFLKLSYQIDF